MLTKEIDDGLESPISLNSHSEIFKELKSKYDKLFNIDEIAEFRELSRHISIVDKDIDILSLDKDINSDI